MIRTLCITAVVSVIAVTGCSEGESRSDSQAAPAKSDTDPNASVGPDGRLASGQTTAATTKGPVATGDSQEKGRQSPGGGPEQQDSTETGDVLDDAVGDEVRPLLVRMSSDAGIERRDAAEALDELGERAIPPVLEALRQGKLAEKRGAAIFLIGRVSPRDDAAVDTLIDELDAEDDALRRAAFQAIERTTNEQLVRAVPALVALAQNDRESEAYRIRAVRAIGKLNGQGRPAVTALVELCDQQSSLNLRRSIYFTVAKAASAADAEEFFCSQFRTDIPADLRRLSAKWLGDVARTDRALEALVAAFDDPVKDVRMQASDSLISIGKPAVSALIKGLKSPGVQTRSYSIMTLGKLRHLATSAAPDLEKLREDPDEEVRKLVAAALKMIPHRP